MVECIKKEFLKEIVENAWKNYKFEDVIIQSVNSIFTKAYTTMITKVNRLGETPTFDYSRIGCAGITGSVEIANNPSIIRRMNSKDQKILLRVSRLRLRNSKRLDMKFALSPTESALISKMVVSFRSSSFLSTWLPSM